MVCDSKAEDSYLLCWNVICFGCEVEDLYQLCWNMVLFQTSQQAAGGSVFLLVGIQTHAHAKRQIPGAILSGILAEMQKSWDIKSTWRLWHHAHTHNQHFHPYRLSLPATLDRKEDYFTDPVSPRTQFNIFFWWEIFFKEHFLIYHCLFYWRSTESGEEIRRQRLDERLSL